jgi:hypothetical protein
VCYVGSQQIISPVASSHGGNNPSTSDSKFGSKKGRLNFPYRLCEGIHRIYLFPCVDGKGLLEKYFISQQKILVGYHKFSIKPPLVDELVNMVPSSVNMVHQVIDLVPSLVDLVVQVVDPVSSLVNPTLPLKSEVQVVNVTPLSFNLTLPLKSEVDTTQIYLVTSYDCRQGEFSLFQ